MLELHVWGPAFSLPSVDPQCLAAVLYLRQLVPKGDWILIASCDDTLSPTNALPALRDGLALVGGFWNIVDHLSKRSGRRWDLDSSNCDPREKADITAFSAFIEAHGRSVLDLSLFVSSENYTSTTRPAYSHLLRWPAQWFISPHKRSMAKARTDHLGMSSLDLDTANGDLKKNLSTPSGSEIIPQSLRLSRQTVTDLVKQPQHATRFRLDALADAFFAPLCQLLGTKHYMLSEEKPCSLDCVAYAHLALAYTPQLPHAWVAEAMKARYPELCQYVERMSREIFGGPVDVSHAFPSSDEDQNEPHADGDKILPWRKPQPKGYSAACSLLLGGTLKSLPLAEHFGNSNTLPEDEVAEARRPSMTYNTSTSGFDIVPPLLAVGSAIAAIGTYMLYSGILSEPAPQRNSLSDMGEAGAMLDMAAFGGQSTVPQEQLQRQGRIPVGLEVDVEVEKNRR